MSEENVSPIQDESNVYQIRQQKLAELREKGFAFPNHFRPGVTVSKIVEEYKHLDAEALKENPIRVAIAGRMMLRRIMGKASFPFARCLRSNASLFNV